MAPNLSPFPAPGLRRIASLRAKPMLKRYDVASASWTGPDLSIAVMSDMHVIAPWVTLDDMRRVADQVNQLHPDLVVLAGDFLAGNVLPGVRADAVAIVDALKGLSAKLGVFAVLGNHDWYDCPVSVASENARNSVIEAFDPTDMTLLRNENVRLTHQSHEFSLVGFDSQAPFRKKTSQGYHDPGAAYRGVDEESDSILIAHEPDYFAQGDHRPALQISGHTHGGQMNLFGWRPMTPSEFGGRYAYGHHQQDGRHMIVSAGIGYSGLPLRIAQPPEVNLITMRSAT